MRPTPKGETIFFMIETCNKQLEPIRRKLQITVTGIQRDGTVANYVDDKTGVERKGPYIGDITTPYAHSATLAPDVISVSLTAILLSKAGEILTCYVLKNGLEIRNTRSSFQITGGPVSGAGSAQVTCLYAEAK